MKLIVPSLKYKDSFLDALMEFEKTKEAGFWKFPDETPRTLESYIERILNHSEGADLPDNWVPCTSYWLIDENNEFVGHINIRHRLNDFLTNFGGHIGYAIGDLCGEILKTCPLYNGHRTSLNKSCVIIKP